MFVQHFLQFFVCQGVHAPACMTMSAEVSATAAAVHYGRRLVCHLCVRLHAYGEHTRYSVAYARVPLRVCLPKTLAARHDDMCIVHCFLSISIGLVYGNVLPGQRQCIKGCKSQAGSGLLVLLQIIIYVVLVVFSITVYCTSPDLGSPSKVSFVFLSNVLIHSPSPCCTPHVQVCLYVRLHCADMCARLNMMLAEHVAAVSMMWNELFTEILTTLSSAAILVAKNRTLL